MVNFRTLTVYLFKLYCGYFVGILFLVIGILTVCNIFDLVQKFKAVYIPSYYFGKLVLYKIPYLLSEIAPILSFVATLFFLKKLTKHNELITILCSGVHIWRIIAPAVTAAIICGIMLITILKPICVLGLQKYEYLLTQLSNKPSNDSIISKSGLLFFEYYQNNKRIIQIGSIDAVNNRLKEITILSLGNKNNILKRIDAVYAMFIDNHLKLFSVKVADNLANKKYDNLLVPTNLSMNDLLNSFISPELVAIWDLSDTIKQLTELGLPIINYQIYFYKQLFKPVIMAITVIFASCFFSLKQRDKSQEKNLILGLFLGFILYFLLEISFKILAYNGMSPFLAILLPNICVLFFSNFVIMHSKKT